MRRSALLNQVTLAMLALGYLAAVRAQHAASSADMVSSANEIAACLPSSAYRAATRGHIRHWSRWRTATTNELAANITSNNDCNLVALSDGYA